MQANLMSRIRYIFLAFLILLSDRVSKSEISNHFELGQPVAVIDGFFNITYVRNTGVAFGILDPVRSPMKSTILAILTIAAIVAVIVYCARTPLNQTLLQTALSLILAGALGNLYDRLRHGYVIDFLEVYYRNYRWPSFNVADSAITTGVALLAIQMFRKDSH